MRGLSILSIEAQIKTNSLLGRFSIEIDTGKYERDEELIKYFQNKGYTLHEKFHNPDGEWALKISW